MPKRKIEQSQVTIIYTSQKEWELGEINQVKVTLSQDEQIEYAQEVGLLINPEATIIENKIRNILGKRVLEEALRDLEEQKVDPDEQSWWKKLWGSQLDKEHSAIKTNLIKKLLANKRYSTNQDSQWHKIQGIIAIRKDQNRTDSSTLKRCPSASKQKQASLTQNQQRTSLACRVQLLRLLEEARLKNIQYSYHQGIRNGRTDEIIGNAIRAVKTASDRDFIAYPILKSEIQAQLDAITQATEANAKTAYSAITPPKAKMKNQTQDTAQITLVGGAELLAWVTHYNDEPHLKPSGDERPSLKGEKDRYNNFISYHTIYSSGLAGFWHYWRSHPWSVTISLLLSTGLTMAMFVPSIMHVMHTSQIITGLMHAWGCSLFAAQGTLLLIGLLFIGATTHILNSLIDKKNSRTMTPRADQCQTLRETLQPQSKEDNLFNNNPIARLYSGICFIFFWLYDYGRSHPIAMLLFAFFYWFPVILVIVNTYGGVAYHGFLGTLYNQIILPVANGLVAVTKSPWFAALAAGFLFGKLVLLAMNTGEKRSRGGLWGFIKNFFISIIDTISQILGLYFLAGVMSGFPALEEISGSWETFNFMTATIKPVIFLFDFFSNPRKSLVGSTLRCILLIPWWVVCPFLGLADTKYDPDMDLYADDNSLNSTPSRFHRACHDLWELIKGGIYELLLFPFRVILYPIFHTLFSAICRIIAKMCCWFGATKAMKTISRFEFGFHNKAISVGLGLDLSLRHMLMKVRFKPVLIFTALTIFLPTFISLLATGQMIGSGLFGSFSHLLLKINTWLHGSFSVLQISTFFTLIALMTATYMLMRSLLPPLDHFSRNLDTLFWASLAIITAAFVAASFIPSGVLCASLCVVITMILQLTTFMILRSFFATDNRIDHIAKYFNVRQKSGEIRQTITIANNKRSEKPNKQSLPADQLIQKLYGLANKPQNTSSDRSPTTLFLEQIILDL